MNKEIQKGKYEHYKGKFYEVIDTVIHSETLEELVLYKALYISKDFPENTLWVRPKNIFSEQVTLAETIVPRFKFRKKY